MTTLVLGATGATGRLVVEELVSQHREVRIIVRSLNDLPLHITTSDYVEVVHANLLDLIDEQLTEYVLGCEAVVSCLGHNLTFKGIFGQPRRLVTDATMRICQAIERTQPERPIKFILMSTTGFQNTLADEKISRAHKVMMSFLRVVLPPHVDNEQAATYLQSSVVKASKSIEWVAVRPDSLTNDLERTGYVIHQCPQYDPIFDSRNTSRLNVARFMTELISTPKTWQAWKSKFPVIYDSD
ncbi:NAD(P)-binding oxidoreductase [Vibrio genomosp. F10]|uniref:NAD(P)-binding oxidoreductase n=1 Tax=Vibrio genomosp. F10 TaxID=723171 RepID=UPI00031AE652|nr:NAD(P)-binding oxidoreductase [Vibrio genomosp. F10]OEF03720.1 NAD-dependent epimerase [Vibrio genomosp. F10 str. 9ZD137]